MVGLLLLGAVLLFFCSSAPSTANGCFHAPSPSAFLLNNRQRRQTTCTSSMAFRKHCLRLHSCPALSSPSTTEAGDRGYVRSIRSFNLAGIVSPNGKGVTVPLENGQNLVAVTGETGSGKSLLVARAMELLTGAKASLSLLGGLGGNAQRKEEESSRIESLNRTASLEMEIVVRGPNLAVAVDAFQNLGLDPSSMLEEKIQKEEEDDNNNDYGVIRIRRTFLLQQTTASSSSALNKHDERPRLKSLCKINGQQVPLKTLSAFAPLVAVVDAATASNALSNPEARMAILDTAVTNDCLTRVARGKENYSHCRQKREQLEQELASRMLPPSFSDGNGGGKQTELLQHWVEELDVFEKRIVAFCNSLLSVESDDDDDDSSLAILGRELALTQWQESSSAFPGNPFASSMLRRLLQFRDRLASFDGQLASARAALDALGSLSSSQSAMTAIKRARKLLFDANNHNINGDDIEASSSRLTAAAEHAHDLLNVVENAISECASFIDDDELGLLRAIEIERSACRVSVDDIDAKVLEWNTLARKHGVSPSSLPSCHAALKVELDGNVEALTLLPEAISDEKNALNEFVEACRDLSKEREAVAERLSTAVTARLPSLGMEKSVFRVQQDTEARKCSDLAAYSASGTLGLDSVDFVLLQRKQLDGSEEIQGRVHEVASLGEKARILLAIECALPGSVGASCGYGSLVKEDSLWPNLAPISVIYDEIDAHVGGHAAVSLASMLVDQSRFSQVIAITHSPSVAAVADLHVVVRKTKLGTAASNQVAVCSVEGPERRREVARMASGDLATIEAEVFADALIRDGANRRRDRVLHDVNFS